MFHDYGTMTNRGETNMTETNMNALDHYSRSEPEGRPSSEMVSALRGVAGAYELSNPALYRLLRDAAATIVRLDPEGVAQS